VKTLKAKLLSALVLLLIVTIMVASSGWYASRTAIGALSTVFVDRVKPLRDLKAVADLYAVNIVDTAHKVRNGNLQWPQGLKSVDEASQGIAKSWKAYSDTYMDTRERTLATDASNLMRSGDGAVKDLTDIMRRQDKTALDKFVVERLYPSIEPISDAIGKLVDLQIDEAQSEYSASEKVFGWAQWAMIVSLLAGAAAFTGTLWVMLKGIIQPLHHITRSMHALAGGDFNVAIVGADRSDEVGQMAGAVEVFKANGLEMERMKREQLAAEQLAAERRKADMNKLADGFEGTVGDIIETVSSASGKLETSAGMLSSTAARSEELTTMVAAASEQATTNVQSVASATEELTSSVNEISRQVQESARMANEAVGQARRTNDRVAELSKAAARIGDVVELINSIAGQTNLLALNATIEAARAGEAGRGFAVVASEVKALAEQTAKATGEIGQQITGIQAATGEAVNDIRDISNTIEKLSEISSTIAAAVEEQGAATQEISRNVQQAAQGTQQVSSNIGDVQRGTSETGSASSQVLVAAQSLASDSNRLKAEVSKFLHTVRAA